MVGGTTRFDTQMVNKGSMLTSFTKKNYGAIPSKRTLPNTRRRSCFDEKDYENLDICEWLNNISLNKTDMSKFNQPN